MPFEQIPLFSEDADSTKHSKPTPSVNMHSQEDWSPRALPPEAEKPAAAEQPPEPAQEPAPKRTRRVARPRRVKKEEDSKEAGTPAPAENADSSGSGGGEDTVPKKAPARRRGRPLAKTKKTDADPVSGEGESTGPSTSQKSGRKDSSGDQDVFVSSKASRAEENESSPGSGHDPGNDRHSDAAPGEPRASDGASGDQSKREEGGDGAGRPDDAGTKSQSGGNEPDKNEPSGHFRKGPRPDRGRPDFQHPRDREGFRPRHGGPGGFSGPRPPKPGFQPGNNPAFGPGKKKKKKKKIGGAGGGGGPAQESAPYLGELPDVSRFQDFEALTTRAEEYAGEPLHLDKLYELSLHELVERARDSGVVLDTAPNRRILISRLLQKAEEEKRPIHDRGILHVSERGYGIIARHSHNYHPQPEDTFVAQTFVRRFGLQKGHLVEAQIRAPEDHERCPAALRLLKVMEKDPTEVADTAPFEDLIPYYPTQRMLLELAGSEAGMKDVSMRSVDLLTPIGFGQRGLIVAPPRTGKTVLLQQIANSVAANNPQAHLIVLLIDERPEEVTDFRRNTKGEVVSSTFDEPADSHVEVAEMVIEKSRRMVENGQHVVILLDSITRLARAYNTMMPNSGKILSGGVEANALQKPKRFFGAARNIEGGGSLTILATALIDTGSRMDEVIFEEFKGTGNMEIHLDRALVDKRVFPALNIEKSGTRKEELLYHPDEMSRIYSLRRAIQGVPTVEAMEMLVQRLKKTKSNAEFLMAMNR